MYKPPIEILEKQLNNNYSKQLVDNYENKICKRIEYVMNVKINKEELIKALEYDRESYNNGYKDGYKEGALDAVKTFIELCNSMIESLIETKILSIDDIKYNE